jgi:hypothetical protein
MHGTMNLKSVTARLVYKAQAAACWFYELVTKGARYTEITCSDLGISTAPENSILIQLKH